MVLRALVPEKTLIFFSLDLFFHTRRNTGSRVRGEEAILPEWEEEARELAGDFSYLSASFAPPPRLFPPFLIPPPPHFLDN